MKNAPRAGDHKAEIRDASGLLPYATGVADINVPLVISTSSLLPANALGGDTLTISGTGFPLDVDLISVKLTSSAGDSICTIKTLTTT